MASNKVSGDLLALEIDGKFVSCETSCEFNFENDLRNASPVTAGRWKEFIPGVRGWSVTLNATMLLASVGSNVNTVLNAFLLGSKMRIRFRSRNLIAYNFVLVGNVFVLNGGISAATRTKATWNVTLTGDGPFTIGDPLQYPALYGYRLADPFGDELNLVPQFSKFFNNGSASIGLDFTQASSGNYLFAIVPHGQPIFNAWENNPFNFGPIPDYLWRPVRTIGGYDYYITQSIQYITSSVPLIVFKYNAGAPTSFSFIPANNVDPLSVNLSNIVTLAGITVPLPFSVSGGEVSINGGAFNTSPGTVNNGDTVQLRQTAVPSYSSTSVTTLTIGTFSAGYSVNTRAALPVTVNYILDYGSDPYVYIGYIPMIDRLDGNGFVEISRILSEATGSITGQYKEGYGIGFRQITFPSSFPWVAGTGAYLKVDMNGSLYYQNTLYVQTTELQNPTYVIPAGTTDFDVLMLGINTGVVGYLTHTLTTDNTLGVLGNFDVTITDVTSGEFYIYVDPETGISAFAMNVLNNLNKLLLTVRNKEAVGNSYRIQGTGGYDQTISIGAGLTGSKNDVPKGSITVTKL